MSGTAPKSVVKNYGTEHVVISHPHEGGHEDVPPFTTQLKNIFTDSYINVLLIFVPLAFLAKLSGGSEGFIFATSFFMLIPLAAMLGDLTEDIALRSNPSIAALINVTFGNATELIISLVALRQGAFDVIRFSLIGSVLGNMLLVLGCAFLASGMRAGLTEYNINAVNVYGSVLMCACLSFVVPTAFTAVGHGGDLLTLSRELAVLSAGTYIAYLIFQLITHASVFDEKGDGEGEEEEETPKFSFWFAFIGIAIVAILISLGSDWLVDSIEGTAASWRLSRHFIGVILVPIVGNAAEHTTAVIQAYKGNIDISFGIAVGSSIQISCFVVPFTVLLAWAFELPFSMDFHPFSTVVMFVSVLVLNTLTTTGKVHWLNGVMLLCAYAMLGCAYLHMPDGKGFLAQQTQSPAPTQHL